MRKGLLVALAGATALMCAGQASATMVALNFDSFAAGTAITSDMFAAYGVTIVGTGVIEAGTSNGGSLGLDGTSGGNFAYFEGGSVTFLFDAGHLNASVAFGEPAPVAVADGHTSYYVIRGPWNEWMGSSLTPVGYFQPFNGIASVPVTGLTLTADGPLAIDNLQFDDTPLEVKLPVPEPATWAMMLLGFFGLGATVRSRRALAAGSVAGSAV